MPNKVGHENEKARHINPDEEGMRSGNPQLEPDSARKHRGERPEGAGEARPKKPEPEA